MSLFGETANLTAELNLKGNFTQEVNKAQKSLSGLNKSVSGGTASVGKMDKAVGGMGAKIKNLGTQAKGSILQGVGLGAGVAGFQLLSTGVSSAISAIGGAISSASDLAESQSKVQAVFKTSSDEVIDWARNLDSSFGISTQAALEAAGTFGNFLQALGQTEQEANSMSEAMVELAGDLGSFNNMAREDVLLALRSGLAGESEPVRRLGIDISELRVETELAAAGVQMVGKSYTQQQKVMGRYMAIMKDTTKAQGDAVRTSGELAGQQRKLDAVTANLSATLGGIVIGPATAFLGFLVDTLDTTPKVSDKVDSLNARIKAMHGELKSLNDEVAGVGDAWQPLTEMDIPPLFKLGIYRDLPPRLLDYANKLKLTREEMLQFIYTNDDSVGSLFDAIDALDATGGAVESYGGELVRATNHMATLKDANDDLTDSYDPLSSIVRKSTTYLRDQADAAAAAKKAIVDARNRFNEFRQNAGSVAETKSLGEINKALAEQRKARRQAAAASQVAKFAAAQAAITELNSQKKVRKEAKSILSEWLSGKREQKASEGTVTKAVDKTQKALEHLDNTKPAIRVDTSAIDAATVKVNDLRARIIALGGSASSVHVPASSSLHDSGSKNRRATGGPVQAFKTYQVNENGTEYFTPQSNGYIHNARETSRMMGGPVSVSVVTNVDLSAARAHDNIDKVVRTNRSRANVA